MIKDPKLRMDGVAPLLAAAMLSGRSDDALIDDAVGCEGRPDVEMLGGEQRQRAVEDLSSGGALQNAAAVPNAAVEEVEDGCGAVRQRVRIGPAALRRELTALMGQSVDCRIGQLHQPHHHLRRAAHLDGVVERIVAALSKRSTAKRRGARSESSRMKRRSLASCEDALALTAFMPPTDLRIAVRELEFGLQRRCVEQMSEVGVLDVRLIGVVAQFVVLDGAHEHAALHRVVVVAAGFWKLGLGTGWTEPAALRN